MQHDRLVRLTLALVALAAALYLWGGLLAVLTRYGTLLMVFVLGWLLAFILNPVISWVMHPHWPRRGRTAGPPARSLSMGIAVLVVYGVILGTVVVLGLVVGPRLLSELARLVQALPDIAQRLQDVVTGATTQLGLPVSQGTVAQATSMTLSQFATAAASAVAAVTTVIGVLAGAVTNVILVLVFALYLNLGGGDLLQRVIALVPRRWQDEAWVFTGDVSTAFGGFLRGQAIYAAISGVLVAVAMLVMGLPFALAAALMAFVLSLIPLFGSFLGLIPPVLIALTVSTKAALLMLVVLGGIQLVLTNAIMPKIFGSSIRMEPIVVFVAIVVGIGVAGLWGAIFAIPLTALAIATIRYVTGRRTDVDRPDFGTDEPPAAA